MFTRLTHGSGRDSKVVLACVNAAGEILSPLIVHLGKHMWPSQISDKAFPGTSYRTTKSSWMDTNTFYSWFTSQFLQQVPKKNRLILLLYDEHLSHISLELMTAARQADVHMIKLVLVLDSNTSYQSLSSTTGCFYISWFKM